MRRRDLVLTAAGSLLAASARASTPATLGAASAKALGFTKPGTAVTTWNPANKFSGYTLSNGNLTVSFPAGGSFGNVTSTTSKSSGKWYFEVTYNSNSSGSGGVPGVGFLPAGFSTSTFIENNGGPVWLTYGEVRSFNNSIVTTNLDKWNNTVSVHTIGIAVDVGATLAWGKVIGGANGLWNGSGIDNPVTGAGGIGLGSTIGANPVFIAGMPVAAGDAFTLNTGQSAFSGTVPSGFTAWG